MLQIYILHLEANKYSRTHVSIIFQAILGPEVRVTKSRCTVQSRYDKAIDIRENYQYGHGIDTSRIYLNCTIMAGDFVCLEIYIIDTATALYISLVRHLYNVIYIQCCPRKMKYSDVVFTWYHLNMSPAQIEFSSFTFVISVV